MKMNFRTPTLTSLFMLPILLGVSAGAGSAQDFSAAEAEALAVVDAYHAALAAGDSTAALSLLTEDVTILESGGSEDFAQYRSGHLSGDMRFAQAVSRVRGDTSVQIVGDVAWVASTSTTEGQMGERQINSQGAELAILVHQDGAWKISAFHWSSRQRR